jgi:hypothetical protein
MELFQGAAGKVRGKIHECCNEYFNNRRETANKTKGEKQ